MPQMMKAKTVNPTVYNESCTASAQTHAEAVIAKLVEKIMAVEVLISDVNVCVLSFCMELLSIVLLPTKRKHRHHPNPSACCDF